MIISCYDNHNYKNIKVACFATTQIIIRIIINSTWQVDILITIMYSLLLVGHNYYSERK